MNKLKIYLIVLTVIIVYPGCKRDYPPDIPRWLKEDIKEMRRTKTVSPNLTIHEWADGMHKVYMYDYCCFDPGLSIIYDEYGSEQCRFKPLNIIPDRLPDTCGNFASFQEFKWIRYIWFADSPY